MATRDSNGAIASVHFPHRFSDFFGDMPNGTTLRDSLSLPLERAQAICRLLEIVKDDSGLPPMTIADAAECIRMEICDAMRIVNTWDQAHGDPRITSADIDAAAETGGAITPNQARMIRLCKVGQDSEKGVES